MITVAKTPLAPAKKISKNIIIVYNAYIYFLAINFDFDKTRGNKLNKKGTKNIPTAFGCIKRPLNNGKSFDAIKVPN